MRRSPASIADIRRAPAGSCLQTSCQHQCLKLLVNSIALTLRQFERVERDGVERLSVETGDLLSDRQDRAHRDGRECGGKRVSVDQGWVEHEEVGEVGTVGGEDAEALVGATEHLDLKEVKGRVEERGE